jgi:hypothetical protein
MSREHWKVFSSEELQAAVADNLDAALVYAAAS